MLLQSSRDSGYYYQMFRLFILFKPIYCKATGGYEEQNNKFVIGGYNNTTSA